MDATDSLFEHFDWFYAFLREWVFRNDAHRIARALRLANAHPGAGAASAEPPPLLLEVGCGPGFYTCQLAKRFPRWQLLGLDRSRKQLLRATEKARRWGLTNCRFTAGNALALEQPDGSVDGVFASRLLTVLNRREAASAWVEMHRVLRPGGRCFLAEPRGRRRTGAPLRVMWLLARLSQKRGSYREPRCATVLAAESFRELVASQPWSEIKFWEDDHYQYALATKGTQP